MNALIAVWWLIIAHNANGGITAIPYPTQQSCEVAAAEVSNKSDTRYGGGYFARCLQGFK